jgi:hypothetical protein
MSSFFNSNNEDLNKKYNTTIIGNILQTFYRTNGIDIKNKFTLYIHGNIEKSYFRVNNQDIGSYLQVDNFTQAIEISQNAYNMSPWNNNSILLRPAKWIWNSLSAASSAPQNQYLWFYYSFYYDGLQNTGNIHVSADNYSATYINGIFIIDSGSFSIATTQNVTILNGFNYIRISAYNAGSSGNPAGLIFALYDSTSTLICVTNKNWGISYSSGYKSGALVYARNNA